MALGQSLIFFQFQVQFWSIITQSLWRVQALISLRYNITMIYWCRVYFEQNLTYWCCTGLPGTQPSISLCEETLFQVNQNLTYFTPSQPKNMMNWDNFPILVHEHGFLDGLESRFVDFIGKLPFNKIIFLQLGHHLGKISLSFTGARLILEEFSYIGVVLVSCLLRSPFFNITITK